MSPTELLIWAAGLYEGEGSCGLKITTSRGKSYRYIVLDLELTDLDTLERFHEAIGWVGRIYGPYFKTDRKPRWALVVAAQKDVEAILEKFYPYLLSRRRKQIRSALSEREEW